MESFIQQKPSASREAGPEQGRRPSRPPPMVEERLNAIAERKFSKPIRGKFPEGIADPAKISEMKEYMRSLGCQFRVGIHNPLSYDARLLSLAIGKYAEIFGCLPTQSLLVFQRLGPLSCSINRIYGGILGMRKACMEGRIKCNSEALTAARQADAETDLPPDAEKQPPASPALSQEGLSEEQKAEAMKEYMRSLGCKFQKRIPNPLFTDRKLFSLAIEKYIEIFGCLPTQSGLNSQRLHSLLIPIQKWGGFLKMREEFGTKKPAAPAEKAGIPLSDDEKINKMLTFLRVELGCRMKTGFPNPLLDRGRLSLAIQKYVEIFGCLPAPKALISQRLTTMAAPINKVYGGFKGMRAQFDPEEAARAAAWLAQEREPAQPRKSFAEPDEERGATKVAGLEDAQYSAEHAAVLRLVRRIFGDSKKIGGASKSPEHAEEAEPIIIDIAPEESPVVPKSFKQRRPAPIKFRKSGTRMMDLENGRYFPDEVKLMKGLINAHPERISTRPGFAKDIVEFSLAKERKIQIQGNAEERRLFFMEKDIPALLFIAKMEMGSNETVEEAIIDLSRAFKRANRDSLPIVKEKLWAARQFYVERRHGLDSERFSVRARQLLDEMFQNPRAFFRIMNLR